MATYTKTKGGSVGPDQNATYTFDPITIPNSEKFKRCKIEKSGSYLGSCSMRGNAANVFLDHWDEWSTNKTGISWSKSGDSPKVVVHNTGSAKYSWNLKVTLETEAKTKYAITVNSGTGGTVTANKASTYEGDTVTLTVTPATNYKLNTLTVVKGSTPVTVSNNTFTMPAGAVTVTATWTQTAFPITYTTNLHGAGTVTGPASALPGETVTVTEVAATGYVYSRWGISTGTISGGPTYASFTMPASAVTVTVYYWKLSTVTSSKLNITPGDNVVITVTPGNPQFNHKYRIIKPGTSLGSNWVDLAQGITTVTHAIPWSWCSYIPDDTAATGLEVQLQTYKGSTYIGMMTAGGMTFTVPASVVPTVAAFTPAVNNLTWQSVGNYFVQSHCAADVANVAGAGAYGSTIEYMTAEVIGYSGADYRKNFIGSSSVTWTTGVLTRAGQTTIRITATDSRGRTGHTDAVINVEGYSAPSGSLSVWRVNQGGTADDMGGYGKFSKTQRYTQVGNNTLTVTLESQGTTETPAGDTGDLLPTVRKEYATTQEYPITLTLADKFETTVITASLPSARFIIYVDSTGTKIAFMKAANKTPPTGKTGTFEISGDTQIYIGEDKLEDLLPKSELHQSVSVNGGYCVVDCPAGTDWTTHTYIVQPIYVSGPDAPVGWSGTLQPYNNNTQILIYVRVDSTVPAEGSIIRFRVIAIKL